MAWAYVQTAEVAGGLGAYDAVGAELGDETPTGLLFHAAGLYEGKLRVIEVWESEADYRRFREERLRPAIEKVAGPGVFSPEWPPAGLEPMDVHNSSPER